MDNIKGVSAKHAVNVAKKVLKEVGEGVEDASV